MWVQLTPTGREVEVEGITLEEMDAVDQDGDHYTVLVRWSDPDRERADDYCGAWRPTYADAVEASAGRSSNGD